MALNIGRVYDLIDARWVTWDEEGQIKLLIAPLSTKGYQDAMNAHTRWAQAQQAGFRRGVRDKELEEARTEAMRRALSEYIIKGWQGVKDEATGEEVAYTPALGYDLLAEDSFLVDVASAAAATETYRKDRVDATAKNSEVLSDSGDESVSTTKRHGSSS